MEWMEWIELASKIKVLEFALGLICGVSMILVGIGYGIYTLIETVKLSRLKKKRQQEREKKNSGGIYGN